LSTTSDNEIGRLFNVEAADLTDFRLYWQYESMNARYEQQTRIYSAILTQWYPKRGERSMDMTVRNALIQGAGVTQQVWDPVLQDIVLIPENSHDVLPVRLSGDHGSFQDCFRRVSSAANARSTTSASASPTPRTSSTWSATRRSHPPSARPPARCSASPRCRFQRMYTGVPANRLGAVPVVDLYHLYVTDTVHERCPVARRNG
jgi:hypothetical protein